MARQIGIAPISHPLQGYANLSQLLTGKLAQPRGFKPL